MAIRSGKIRIIGGQWRSRRLQFPVINNLRPSPDAVRETLFNWLRQDLVGSQCLDLFAGSGAIGFEAASRGATSVTMVEAHPTVARQLMHNTGLLDAARIIKVITTKAEKFVATCEQRFDCVFLDPPFDANLVATICATIERQNIIGDGGIVYLETRTSHEPLPIPASWHIIRHKRRGIVQSTLLEIHMS